MYWLPEFLVVFLSLFIQGIPFLLLGSVIGALVTAFCPPARLAAFLPRNRFLGILAGLGAAFFIPSCECIAVPLIRRLIGRGLPVSFGVAYLLASPTLNPVCLLSTWVAFQYDYPLHAVLVRAGGSALIAGVAAFLLTLLPVEKLLCHDPVEENCPVCTPPLAATAPLAVHNSPSCEPCAPPDSCGPECHDHGPCQPSSWLMHRFPRLGSAAAMSVGDFLNVSMYYIAGCMAAAALQTILPSYLVPTNNPNLMIPSFMGLAVGLSVCSSADAFVVRAFTGYPLACLFAFLWMGAVLDLKLLLMYQTLFKKRAVLLLALILILSVFILARGAASIPLEKVFSSGTGLSWGTR